MYSPDEWQSFTDDRLLVLLQTDSAPAFSEIYRRYWLPLYKAVQKRVQDTALTEDILQNIFVSFWNNRLRMKGDLLLPAYLFGAARNQVFKTLRTQNRLSSYYQYARQFGVLAEDAVENTVSAQQFQQHIFSQVRNLPGKGKEAYLLNREQGLSVAEVAEKLQLSPKTVEGHITRISRLIRTYVEKGLLFIIW